MRIQRLFLVRFVLVVLLFFVASSWIFGTTQDKALGLTATENALNNHLAQLRNNPTIQAPAGGGFTTGTSGNDRIIGSSTVDSIDGEPRQLGGGNDLIYGMGSPDTIRGGSIVGYAGSGNDILFGGDGEMNGDLYGGSGCTLPQLDPFSHCDDNMFGNDGNDFLVGEGGDDFLMGGLDRAPSPGYLDVDNDVLLGGNENDDLIGGYGDDTLVGGLGNDRIKGSSGYPLQDINHAFDGIDTLWGDEEGQSGRLGADLFILGANGIRYYDDNLYYSNGRSNYAKIKDFNPAADRIQLAQLPPLPNPPIGSIPNYVTDRASNWIPGSPGIAILYTSGVSGQQPEVLAVVETLTSLDVSRASTQVIFD